MNKDTIVGIAGAVILIGAMVGVFQYEGSRAASSLGTNAFDVSWATASANGPAASASTEFQQTSTTTLDVTQANLTQVQLTVTWTATNGKDTLRVRVTPPEASGLAANESVGDSGTITIAFDVPNTLPPTTTMFANGEEDARARLASTNTKTLGTGTWTVDVTFESATGIQTVPGLPPIQPDATVAWDAATILTSYEPRLVAT